jgi:hypothetical protein
VELTPYLREKIYEAVRMFVSAVRDRVASGPQLLRELGHLEEAVVQDGIAFALEGYDVGDAMGVNVTRQ